MSNRAVYESEDPVALRAEVDHLRQALKAAQLESDRRGRLIESMRLRIEELRKIVAEVLESVR